MNIERNKEPLFIASARRNSNLRTLLPDSAEPVRSSRDIIFTVLTLCRKR